MIEVSSINSRYDGVGCLMERRKPLRLSCLFRRNKFCNLRNLFELCHGKMLNFLFFTPFVDFRYLIVLY